MSRTFAFAIGVAIITLVLWLLFRPAQPPADGGIPRTGDISEPAGQGAAGSQAASGQNQEIPATANGSNASFNAAPSAQKPNVPAPIPGSDQPRPASITLWQQASGNAETDADGFPATRLQADPGLLDSFHVGQELIIDIPDLQQPVTARLETTHNQLDKVQVFRGPITDRGEYDNVIVTRGDTATYVVVATTESVWSAVIDHRTGETLLTDERDILVRQQHENPIPVPGIDQEPPSPENSVN